MLSAVGLKKSFRHGRGVSEVSLRLGEREIVGLLGSNGAGKTTTFRLLTGDLRPDAGTVRLGERDVGRWPLSKRVRVGGLGYLPQDPSLFDDLSVEDNLLSILQAHRVHSAERMRRCNEMLERLHLDAHRKTLAGKLSGGLKRRAEFARCLLCRPRVILLDEPFSGVDPITVEEIQRTIRTLRTDGMSFLISDHKVAETLALVDRVYVMHEGRALFEGSPNAAVRHPEVRRHYLGDGLGRSFFEPPGTEAA